jgi:hypothetical protein
MQPKPWSFSALDDFCNCPKSFHAKRIEKSVQEERSEQMIWGEQVHKHFEDRLNGVPLPEDLQGFEHYMAKLEALPGTLFTEQKIAMSKKLTPCHFFADDVFFRGIIDVKIVNAPTKYARLIDYKTGKPHDKTKQLALSALHTFALHDDVDLVDCRYFWTKTQLETKKVYGRAEIEALWSTFIPDLRQYMEAFKTDTWQARPSGLCNGWCPVTSCQHWKPRRTRY